MASVKRNFVHIIVFAFAVVIIIIIIIITCSDPTARIIMLKVLCHKVFYFLMRKSFQKLMMKNGAYFIVIALLVALLFKILFYAS